MWKPRSLPWAVFFSVGFISMFYVPKGELWWLSLAVNAGFLAYELLPRGEDE